MAGESKLQKKIRNKLKSHGWLVVKINLCSQPGWPDLYCLNDSINMWLEIKDNKPLDPLQEYIHEKIIYHGGLVHKVGTWEEFLSLELI